VRGDHRAQTGCQIRRLGNRGLRNAIAVVATAIIAGSIALST
jgi:hypothetical protein